MEESYRAYYKNAFEASAIHPAEVVEEAERIRAAICARVGLLPSPEGAVPSAGCKAGAEGVNSDSGGGEGDEDNAGLEENKHGGQNVRHWKNVQVFVCVYVSVFGWKQSKSLPTLPRVVLLRHR